MCLQEAARLSFVAARTGESQQPSCLHLHKHPCTSAEDLKGVVSGLDELEKDKAVLSQRLLYLMTQEGETWSREGAKASADTGEIAALQKRIESVVRTDQPSSPRLPAGCCRRLSCPVPEGAAAGRGGRCWRRRAAVRPRSSNISR